MLFPVRTVESRSKFSCSALPSVAAASKAPEMRSPRSCTSRLAGPSLEWKSAANSLRRETHHLAPATPAVTRLSLPSQFELAPPPSPHVLVVLDVPHPPGLGQATVTQSYACLPPAFSPPIRCHNSCAVLGAAYIPGLMTLDAGVCDCEQRRKMKTVRGERKVGARGTKPRTFLPFSRFDDIG